MKDDQRIEAAFSSDEDDSFCKDATGSPLRLNTKKRAFMRLQTVETSDLSGIKSSQDT